MTKTSRMHTLRWRMSPRWERVLGQRLSFCMRLHEMSTWRFVSIPNLFSFCPVHRQASFSLPLLVGIYLLPFFFFFSLAKLHIWASVSSQCFIQTSTQPVTPTVDQPDSMRTLPTPLSLRHLVQRLQFCTIDPCLTYLTAESREPEPHSRSQPFADPTSK